MKSRYRARRMSALAGLAFGIWLSFPSVAEAGPYRAASEIAEQLVRKGARHSKGELAKRLTRIERAHGKRALQAVDRSGYRGLQAIETAGKDADVAINVLAEHGESGLRVAGRKQSLQLARLHGDDATRAMIRHPGVAEDVIAAEGKAAARALRKLDTQNARRLGILERDGTLDALGRGDEVLGVVARRGDAAMEFIWKHKGVLASAALLTAFLADPDPYIDGAKSLVGEVGDSATAPATALAEEAGRNTNWTLLGLAGIGVVTFFVLVAMYRWRRSNGVVVNVSAAEPKKATKPSNSAAAKKASPSTVPG